MISGTSKIVRIYHNIHFDKQINLFDSSEYFDANKWDASGNPKVEKVYGGGTWERTPDIFFL